jgi:hypothetical protein
MEKRGTAGGVGGYAVQALAQILLLLALLMGASVLIARGWVQQGRERSPRRSASFLAAAAGIVPRSAEVQAEAPRSDPVDGCAAPVFDRRCDDHRGRNRSRCGRTG